MSTRAILPSLKWEGKVCQGTILCSWIAMYSERRVFKLTNYLVSSDKQSYAGQKAGLVNSTKTSKPLALETYWRAITYMHCATFSKKGIKNKQYTAFAPQEFVFRGSKRFFFPLTTVPVIFDRIAFVLCIHFSIVCYGLGSVTILWPLHFLLLQLV